MITTVKSAADIRRRIGYALIQTGSRLIITQVMITGQSLDQLILNLVQEEGLDAACHFATAKISPPPCAATRIVLAKFENLISEKQAKGQDVSLLKRELARLIAKLQRNELQTA